MPNISLTEFIDFMVATGTSRLTKVRQAKCRDDYDPRTDYWKPLRDGIVAFHDPANAKSKNQYFSELVAGTHPNKIKAYTDVSDNYKRFLGRKTITKLPIARSTWTHGDLTVRINPEIFLNIDGSRNLIKLYFKQDPLSKAKTDAILTLMSAALPATARVDEYAIYDGRNNRLIRAAAPAPGLMVLIRAEAAAYSLIWDATVCP